MSRSASSARWPFDNVAVTCLRRSRSSPSRLSGQGCSCRQPRTSVSLAGRGQRDAVTGEDVAQRLALQGIEVAPGGVLPGPVQRGLIGAAPVVDDGRPVSLQAARPRPTRRCRSGWIASPPPFRRHRRAARASASPAVSMPSSVGPGRGRELAARARGWDIAGSQSGMSGRVPASAGDVDAGCRPRPAVRATAGGVPPVFPPAAAADDRCARQRPGGRCPRPSGTLAHRRALGRSGCRGVRGADGLVPRHRRGQPRRPVGRRTGGKPRPLRPEPPRPVRHLLPRRLGPAAGTGR